MILGCAPKGSHRVTNIVFDGNGMQYFGFDRDDTLRSSMIQKKTPLLWRLQLRSDSEIQELQLEELRIDGKKRDDLQEAIKLIKDLNLKHPLQYENFRD